MARVLSGLFGNNKQTQGPATALRVDTSLQGLPIPVLLGGVTRIAGNLIDYYGFTAVPQSSSSSGGKGGITGSGSKGQSGQYNYYVTFLLALAEGRVAVDAFYVNGNFYGAELASDLYVLGDLYAWSDLYTPDFNTSAGLGQNYEIFEGDYLQEPWSATEAFNVYGGVLFPVIDAVLGDSTASAYGYRGIAYAAFPNYPLGNSTALPNFTFVAQCLDNCNAIAGQPDGDPSIAATIALTDPNKGIGFPPACLGSLALYQSYCLALGLVVSPAQVSATALSSFLNDLTTATNSAWCWQDGLLTAVPYGDQPVSSGEISNVTETHQVPAGADGNLNYPAIQVSFWATFVADGGVAYQSGGALTKVTVYQPSGLPDLGVPTVGQYYEINGTYYFNPADINNEVLITYSYAAQYSYVPQTQTVYDFTIDDCLPNQASIGSGISDPSSPFIVVAAARDQMLTSIKLEYLDRTNNYNPVLIEIKDEAAIIQFGRERPSDVKQMHMFALASAAQISTALQLGRAQIARTFQCTVGRHFTLILELMAIYTVTDPGQGLDEQPVRLIEIQENDDFSLTLTFEEFFGTATAPEYGMPALGGASVNYNASPGSINAPLIFEPTDEQGDGNYIGVAVSGQDPALFGGAQVYVATSPTGTYTLKGTAYPARMGVLTAPLPAIAVNPNGQTIDQVNTVAVNLSESDGSLGSGTLQDAIALADPCYVGGEVLTYADATLTGPNQYDLTGLVRGVYGTEDEIVAHPAGTPFARLDDAIEYFEFDPSLIGQTIYIKFAPFNVYGGAGQSLSSVPAYPYTIQGTALGSPLPTVENVRVYFDVNLGFTVIDWDPVDDFRNPLIQIKLGATEATAMALGPVAMSGPFRVPGNGTFWVAAVATPSAGLTVYSESWVSVVVSGAIITQNVITQIDLKALGWPGTFTGGAGVDGVINAIRTGAGNLLTDASILSTSDILSYGGAQSGSYFPGAAATVDLGYVANASISVQYQPTGVPVAQNILSLNNILSQQDVLGAANTQFITVTPLISTANTSGGLGTYQSFSPGTYQCQYVELAMALGTTDPGTYAYNLAFIITISVAARIDNYALTTSASGNLTLDYTPGGAQSLNTNGSTATSSAVLHVASVPSWLAAGMYAYDANTPASIASGQTVQSFDSGAGTITLTGNVNATVNSGDLIYFSSAPAAAFNFGPNQGTSPKILGTIVNAQAGDDLIITSPTLSTLQYGVKNAGSFVSRAINLVVEGA